MWSAPATLHSPLQRQRPEIRAKKGFKIAIMYYRNKILKTSLSLQADVVSKSFARPTHQNSLLYITRHTQIRCAAYMFVVTLCQSVVYWDSNSVCPSQLQPGICWHRGETLGVLYPLATSVIPAYKQTKCIRLCIIYKNDTSSNERKN